MADKLVQCCAIVVAGRNVSSQRKVLLSVVRSFSACRCPSLSIAAGSVDGKRAICSKPDVQSYIVEFDADSFTAIRTKAQDPDVHNNKEDGQGNR